MNKLIVIAALALAGSPAFASKARVNALGNSRQLVDVQYTFERPYLLSSVGEMVTIEWGDKGAANPHAEGGFIKKHGDSVYGLYLGKKGLLSGKTTANYLPEQNPINLMYGSKFNDLTWGVNLNYSNGKDEGVASSPKTSTTGLTAGVTNGTWEVELGTSLTGKAEDNTTGANKTIEVKNAMNVGFGYNINEAMHAYATYATSKVETTGVAAADENTKMQVGFINTVSKTEDANFFYGVAYSSDVTKDTTETTALPVWMGIESMATSWMTLRASVQQNILLNETTDKTVTPNKKSDLDSIAFNAGAGFKLGKGMLDASFGTAKAGHLSFSDGTSQFLSQVSYSYMF